MLSHIVVFHSKYFHLYQFNPNYDDDHISIQEVDSNGNLELVAYLTGPDNGPKSKEVGSNWEKKLISISTNEMIIEFKSDDFFEFEGFSANIYFTPIPNKECDSWLDMNQTIFKSPNYPQTYHNSNKCSWLITVDHNYHITLDFIDLYVRYQIHIYYRIIHINDHGYYFVLQKNIPKNLL